jgi:hypothetical protein
MDSDLIPAVCPNCGGKLQVDPGADTLVCQFCGTEHLIRRNVSGAVTLEAFARCPLCKRNDQVEKISAILHKQTSQSDGFIPQQKIYTDSQGHTYSRTVNVPVQTVQASTLARRLVPPPPPPTKPTSRPIVVLLIFAIILAVVGVCGFIFAVMGYISSTSSYYQSGALSSSVITALVCGFTPFLVSVGMFVLWYFLRKKDQERLRLEQSAINDAYQRWQQARARWEKLYYCGRDDIVFIPGEKTSATVADMIAYLYTSPRK